MRGPDRPAVAVLRLAMFSLGTNLGSRRTRFGFAAATLVVLLGPFGHWRAGDGWTYDNEFAFLGFLLAVLFVLRSGLEEQRESGLAPYLSQNFYGPGRYAAGMIVSLMGSLAVTLAWLFAVRLAGGDSPADAAWGTLAWGTRSLVFTGAVLWVEELGRFHLPAILPVLVYFGLAFALVITVGEDLALRLYVQPVQEEPRTLLPLAAQAMASTSVFVGSFLVWTRVRSRHRRRLSTAS